MIDSIYPRINLCPVSNKKNADKQRRPRSDAADLDMHYFHKIYSKFYEKDKTINTQDTSEVMNGLV